LKGKGKKGKGKKGKGKGKGKGAKKMEEETPEELFTMSENVEASPSNAWVWASAAMTAGAVGYTVYSKHNKAVKVTEGSFARV